MPLQRKPLVREDLDHLGPARASWVRVSWVVASTRPKPKTGPTGWCGIFAIEIDATPQQQERLREIAKTAVKDLIPLREQAQARRERARTLLTQSTIDRAAIETFRADQMTLADTASKRIAQALANAADVLTPEQRRKIDERIMARRAYWRGWHRG